jgi:hypothetical protein
VPLPLGSQSSESGSGKYGHKHGKGAWISSSQLPWNFVEKGFLHEWLKAIKPRKWGTLLELIYDFLTR